MIEDALGRARIQAGVSLDRARARLDHRPIVAVLAGTGDDNFGDEWMAEALRSGLPSCRLAEITHPATEGRLTRLGLSGARLFSGVVVSGGTLINPYFLPRVLPLLRADVPAWTVGTGVGSAGFGVTESSAVPDGWVRPLRRFEEVAVRGPRSAARLAAAGYHGATAIGDLALAHTPDAPVQTSASRRLLVNVSGTELEASNGEGPPEAVILDAIAGGVRLLVEVGWEPVPLLMHRDDLPRLQAVGRMIGGWTSEIVAPKTANAAQEAMAQAGALVGMRLHAAALGWIHGVPTLGLAYRDKTLDFADHVGAGDQVADLRAIAPAELQFAVGALVHRPIESAHAVHRRALDGRAGLTSLMARIEARVTAAQPA